ncbi:MAG: hypothetical protein KAR38_11420 [Calditrichia bacterium]|nr:hypothetical protein [Calditrichia bacterium]
MKKLIIIFLFTTFLLIQLPAQERNSNPLKNLQNGIGTQFNAGYLMNIFPIQNFDMKHQLSASVMTGGNNSLMMNSYMNTMYFDFSFPLKVRLDLGLMNFPYSSQPMDNNLQKQFFGSLSMQYQPTKNTFISLSLSKGPALYYPYMSYPSNYHPVNFFNDN